MIRRFVIGVEGLNKDQEAILRDFLDTNGTWWHWISNLWLFVTTDEALSASDIYSVIKGATDKRFKAVVFEFPEDITWTASATTNAKGKKMTDWLRGAWLKGK